MQRIYVHHACLWCSCAPNSGGFEPFDHPLIGACQLCSWNRPRPPDLPPHNYRVSNFIVLYSPPLMTTPSSRSLTPLAVICCHFPVPQAPQPRELCSLHHSIASWYSLYTRRSSLCFSLWSAAERFLEVSAWFSSPPSTWQPNQVSLEASDQGASTCAIGFVLTSAQRQQQYVTLLVSELVCLRTGFCNL